MNKFYCRVLHVFHFIEEFFGDPKRHHLTDIDLWTLFSWYFISFRKVSPILKMISQVRLPSAQDWKRDSISIQKTWMKKIATNISGSSWNLRRWSHFLTFPSRSTRLCKLHPITAVSTPDLEAQRNEVFGLILQWTPLVGVIYHYPIDIFFKDWGKNNRNSLRFVKIIPT